MWFRGIALVLFLVLGPAFAEASHPEETEQTSNLKTEYIHNDNPVRHSSVLLQNRNNQIGLQFQTDLRFIKWSTIPLDADFHSSIGISEANRLYHHIQIGKDHFARLLSGDHCIKDFRLLTHSLQLIALTCDNEVLVYNSDKWQKSPKTEILRKRLKQSAVVMTLITAVTFGMVHFEAAPDGIYDPNLIAGMISIFGNLGHAQLQLMFGLNEYDYKNKHPDGLMKTDLVMESLNQLTGEMLLNLNLSEVELAHHWATNCERLLSTRTPELSTKKYDEGVL